MRFQKQSRVQKPGLGRQLDKDNSLTKGMVLCYPFNERGGTPIEVIKHYPTTFVVPADISWNNSLPGPVLRFTDAANQHYVNCGIRSEVNGLEQISIFARFLTTTLTGGAAGLRSVIDKIGDPISGWVLRIRTTLAPVESLDWTIFNGDYRTILTAANVVKANTWYNVIAIYNTNAAINNLQLIVFAENSSLLTWVKSTVTAGNITSGLGILAIGSNTIPGHGVRHWAGDIALSYLWNRAISDAEVMSLLQNPYQIFLPKKRQVFFAVADLNLPLTGVSASSAVGTLALLISLTLSGISATASVGSVTSDRSISISGNQVTISVSSVIADRSISLSGVSATGFIGNLIPDRSILLSGNQATGFIGSVTPTQVLSSVQAIGSPGTILPNRALALSGIQATGSIGSVILDRSILLSGNLITGSIGIVSPDRSILLTGNSITASVGIIIPNRAITISGNQVTGLVGTVIYSAGADLSLPITGISAIGSAGTTIPNRTISISGNLITGNLGSLIPTQIISGIVATGSTGTVTPNRTITTSGNQLSGFAGIISPDKTIIISTNLATGSVGTTTLGININLSGVSSVGNVGNLGITGPIIIKKIKFTGQTVKSPDATSDTLKTPDAFADSLISGH